ncbi:MAG: Trm112 family protein [Myxococcota bacterium]
MPISPTLLEILVCPETRQPVSEASDDVLGRINAEVEAGRLRNRGGEAVEKPLVEALIREDGRVIYPVDDGIPVMLIEQSIEVSAA